MRIPSILSIAFLALSTLGAPLPTHAAWTPDGIVLVEYYQGVYPYLMEARPDGGLLVRVPYAAFGGSVRTDRIDGDGSVSWSRGSVPGSGTFDGQGGVYETYKLGSAWAASRITPAGVSWPYGAVTLFPDNGLPITTAPDGSGGLYAAKATSATNLKLKRLLADGTFAAGWPAAGVELSISTGLYGIELPVSLPDGSGGVLVGWTSYDGAFLSLLVERVDANGDAYFGGAYVTDDLTSAKETIALARSGPDHFFDCFIQSIWNAQTQTYFYEIRLQRIAMLDGSTAPGWPAAGVLVRSTQAHDVPDVLSDGGDGILFAWRDGPSVKGLRFLSDGTLATGWPAAGLSLLDAAAVLPPGPERAYFLTAQAGALVIAWTDQRDGTSRVRARWLLPDGTPDPQQPESGRVVTPNTNGYALGATSDGNGGVYVGWLHQRWGPPLWEYNRYMVSWVPYENVLAVPPPHTATLDLGTPWPNPARRELNLRFALDDDSPARLELIDVAGHRVRSMDVRGAGEHVKRFERLDALSPGVYFVRLTHRGRTSTSQVALVN